MTDHTPQRPLQSTTTSIMVSIKFNICKGKAHRFKASGVAVHDDCIPTYKALKTRKYKYMIFTLSSDNQQIVVAKTSTNANYDEFLEDLPEDQCRWAVYDLEFEKDGAKRNKICFIAWWAHLITVEIFTENIRCYENTLGLPTKLKSNRRWCSHLRNSPCDAVLMALGQTSKAVITMTLAISLVSNPYTIGALDIVLI